MIIDLFGKKPNLGKNVFVAPNAVIVGDVEIGDSSSLWFNSVLRGDINRIRIGKKTNIQDNSVIHVDDGIYQTEIGDCVTIGHGAILHGCKIGNNVLIGIGAIILNGTQINDNSIVAAGSVVLSGTVIPSGKLFAGVPAKEKREISEDEIKDITASALHYVEKIEKYINSTK